MTSRESSILVILSLKKLAKLSQSSLDACIEEVIGLEVFLPNDVTELFGSIFCAVQRRAEKNLFLVFDVIVVLPTSCFELFAEDTGRVIPPAPLFGS